MDVETLLATHERQSPQTAMAVNIVRRLLHDHAAVDDEQYQPGKAAALKAARSKAAVEALAEELQRIERVVDERVAAEIAAAAEAERTRLMQPHRHVVEIGRIDRAVSAAEVALVLRDAEAIGLTELRTAWNYAKPRLEQLARADIRQHRLPGGRNDALAVLTTWQAKVAAGARVSPDAGALRERGEQEKRELRSRFLQIADVMGLTAAFKVALVPRPVVEAEGTGGKFVVGIFWEKFPDLVRRS